MFTNFAIIIASQNEVNPAPFHLVPYSSLSLKSINNCSLNVLKSLFFSKSYSLFSISSPSKCGLLPPPSFCFLCWTFILIVLNRNKYFNIHEKPSDSYKDFHPKTESKTVDLHRETKCSFSLPTQVLIYLPTCIFLFLPQHYLLGLKPRLTSTSPRGVGP